MLTIISDKASDSAGLGVFCRKRFLLLDMQFSAIYAGSWSGNVGKYGGSIHGVSMKYGGGSMEEGVWRERQEGRMKDEG
jgi:hypothetical protein